MRKIMIRAGLVAAATTGLLVGSAPAFATPPGPGVSATVLWRTTVGSTDYVLRQITLPPGQSTGWHYHDGVVYGVVLQGTLSHFDSTCQSNGVYSAGRTLSEPAGPENVHIGRNLGTVPVVLDALYVLPHGAPFSEDAPNPGCSFQ